MSTTCKLTVTETSVDQANNKSTISVKLTATTAGQSHNNYTSGVYYPSGTITINGTSYGIGHTLPYNSTVTLYNKSHTIAHNSDGTKSVTVKYSFNTHIYEGILTGTKTLKLTDISIDRKSVPTVSSTGVAIGSTITINMNPYMSSYTHSISYIFNNSGTSITSGLSAASGIKDSCTFTPPASLLNHMDSNATSANALFTVNTYKSDGTFIGSSTFTVTVTTSASSYPPTMNSVSASVYSNGTAFTDIYVKNYNGVTLSFSATGQRGATIESYRITGPGILSVTTTSTTHTINKLAASGNLTFKVIATDSRGATCSGSVTIKVSNYAPPSITNVSSVRCDVSGNPSDEGTYIKANVAASYSNIGNNVSGSIIIKMQYAAEGGGYNSGNNLNITKSAGTATGTRIVGGSLGDGAYKILYTITDAYNKTNTYTDVLSTSFYVLDINSGGTSVGIGAAASDADHVLTIGMDQITFPNATSLSLNINGFDFASDTFQITSKDTTLNNTSLTLKNKNTTLNSTVSMTLDATTLNLDSTAMNINSTSITSSAEFLEYTKSLNVTLSGMTINNSDVNGIQINSDYVRIKEGATLAAVGWTSSGTTSTNSFNVGRMYCESGIDMPNNIAYRCTNTTDAIVPCLFVNNSNYCFLSHNDLAGTVLRGKTVKLSSASGITVTSDERVKKDFKTLEGYEDFFMSLKPIAYKYLTGTSDRYHVGFKAQDVKSSLENNKLTTQDFGGYVETDPDTDFYMKTLGYDPFDGGKMCALSYEEFVGLAVHMIQKQHDQIKELKDRVAVLERGDN